MKRIVLMLAFASISVFLFSASSFSDPVASLSIQADPVQPAGLPIALRLIVTNTGNDPLTYYAFNFAPIHASYPDARLFTITVTDSQGRIRKIGPRNKVVPVGNGLRVQQQDTPYEICNGQTLYSAFSGHILSIRKGEILSVPISLSALPPGSYTLGAESNELADEADGIRYVTWPMMQTLQPVPVTITEDTSLSRQRSADLLDGTLRQDMFALAAVSEFKVQLVIDVLVSDLTNPDPSVALSAAKAINLLRPVPDNIGEIVYHSIVQHLDADNPKGNIELLEKLNELRWSIRDDNTLKAAEMIAFSHKDSQLRCEAVAMLKWYKPTEQGRIVQELHQLLTDPDNNVRGAVAVVLADNRDAVALPVLLSLVHLPNPYQNFLYPSLAKFPDDPRVEPAIRSGLNDKDEWSRSQAADALKTLAAAKRGR